MGFSSKHSQVLKRPASVWEVWNHHFPLLTALLWWIEHHKHYGALGHSSCIHLEAVRPFCAQHGSRSPRCPHNDLIIEAMRAVAVVRVVCGH